MGCGSTYNGSARYRLGPAYVPQNERTRVELLEPVQPGPQIDLSNLKKNALQSRIVGSRIDPADGIRQSTTPPNREENAELFRSNRFAQSQVNTNELIRNGTVSQEAAPATIPLPVSPTLHGLSQIKRVESRDMTSLGLNSLGISNIQTVPMTHPQLPYAVYQDIPRAYQPAANSAHMSTVLQDEGGQSNQYRTPFPYPPPQIQMVSTMRTTGQVAQTSLPAAPLPQPPPGFAQRSEKDTQIMRTDGSRMNIHETITQGAGNSVPPLHIPKMNLEPMGDEQSHPSKMMSFDYRKVEKPSVG